MVVHYSEGIVRYALILLFSILGMMIETMAGKSSSLHGLCHDCTPFAFSEDRPAVDHFGKLLVKGEVPSGQLRGLPKIQ